jgi:carboxyl-terminal processing protease
MSKPLSKLAKTLILFIVFGLGFITNFFYSEGFGRWDDWGKTKNEEFSFEPLNEMVSLLKEDFLYREDIDDEKLMQGALKGMVEALDEPYTVYFNPEDFKDFNAGISGEFEGIGAEIGKKDGSLIVVTPLKGTPADKAGLESGDIILKINDEIGEGLSVAQAVNKIRGPKDTEVVLVVGRKEEIKKFKIKRGVIKAPDMEVTKKDGVVYAQVYQFENGTAQRLGDKILALDSNPDKIVLDLRGNPGGFLQEAIDMVGLFVPKGSIVLKERMNTNSIRKMKTDLNPKFENAKVVVILNEGSASASEIVAGALRDLEGTKIVGKKSYGKGVVQALQDLDNDSAVKITIAEWLTPNDHKINKVGLEPDLEVDLGEDVKIGDDNDEQLRQALKTVKE